MSPHRLLQLLILGLAYCGCATAVPSSPPWQTCFLIEGKADGCGPGDQPRPFHEFLTPGAWSNAPGDLFSSEFRWTRRLKVTWREIGHWGSHRVRSVHYTEAGSALATIILAEGSRNIFSLLMKWSGEMPDPVTCNHDGINVLVLQKDYSGLYPTVDTWAWIWGPHGPVRLNLSAAMADAIQKVAPGYQGYDTALDWRKLHTQTSVWKGNHPGKVFVGHTVEAWFELAPEGLILKRANFGDAYGDGPRTARWPRPSLDPAPPKPSQTEVTVELKDLRGTPVSAAQIRVKGGTATKTDSRGIASIPLPSPLPEDSPVLLEIIGSPRPLVILAPCQAVIPVSRSARAILVAPKGDARILTTPLALASLADCLLRTSPPQDQYQETRYPRHRRQALDSLAKSISVTPKALDAAIRTWGRQAQDPFSRGLIALYDQRPAPAIAHLRKAIPALVDPGQIARAEFYLGRALYAQRRFAEANVHYARSDSDSALLRSRAWALLGLQDFKGAEQELRRVLSTEERLFGPNAPSVGLAAKELADVLYYTPGIIERESLHQRAVAIAEQTAGPDSADYAQAIHDLGVLTEAMLDHPASKTHFDRALAIRQKVLGPQDPETAESLEAVGLALYRRRNSCPETLPLFRKVLAIREKAFGPNHPSTAFAINSVGLCLEEIDAPNHAEEHYRQALSIMENTVGEDEPLQITAFLNNIANLLGKRGRLPEAVVFHRRALAILEDTLGPEHPEIINTLYDVALTLAAAGQGSEAGLLLRRAATLREAASGPDSSDLADILGNLAALLVNQGNLPEAEPLLRRALAIQERTVAPNHEDTAKSLNDLAILLDRKGELPEALALCERAVAMYNATLGPLSQQTLSAQQLLNDLRKRSSK